MATLFTHATIVTMDPARRILEDAALRVEGERITGIGPDLMQAARQAVSNTIDWLCREHAMPAEQAYMLCSVCGDLRISEVVDLPNWVVSFYFPKVVFA